MLPLGGHQFLNNIQNIKIVHKNSEIWYLKDEGGSGTVSNTNENGQKRRTEIGHGRRTNSKQRR